MVVMILENVPVPLRGELTRWLIEVRAGVFVGHVSALVRDRLWLKCSLNAAAGGVVQAWSTNNEQRFTLRLSGDTSRTLIDLEGVQLIKIPANGSTGEVS
jgi:CRISPR-associated protein Cas2